MAADRRLRAGVLVLAAAGAIAAFATRLDFGPQPEVTRWRDDAFYIFVWARSVAEGNGPCIVPGVPTTGLQLSWGLLLAAIGWLFGSAAIPLGAQLAGLGSLLGFAGVVARLTGPGCPGAIVALLALGQPWLVTEAQNGQETAFALLLLGLLVLRRSAAPAVFWPLALLVTFTRSDFLFFVAALALLRGRALPALAGAAALVAAHAAVQLAIAGHPVQDSAAPIPWLFWQHELATHGSDAAWTRAWWWLRPVLLGGPYLQAGAMLTGIAVALALAPWLRRKLRALPLLLTAIGLLLGAEQAQVAIAASLLLLVVPRALPPDRLVPALLAAGVALVFTHGFVRHNPRVYYFAPLVLPGLLALGGWLRMAPLGGLLLAAAVAGEQALRLPERPELRPWQAEMVLAGEFLDRVVPPGEPVGCFNSGIVAWRHDGPIVNLDGVAHRAAFEALRAARLDAFLDERRIRLLLDTPVQFRRQDPWPHASGRWFGPEFDPARDLLPLVRFDLPGIGGGIPGTDAFVLYWRRGRGVPPPLPAHPADLGVGPGGGRVLWLPAGGAFASGPPGGPFAPLPSADVAQILELPAAGPRELRAGGTTLLRW